MKILAAILALIPGGATAQANEDGSVVIYEEGPWVVTSNIDYCKIENFNNAGQRFMVGVSSDGAAAVAVSDPTWQMPDRLQDFVMEINDKPTELSEDADGQEIFALVPEAAVSVLGNEDPWLVEDIANGDTIRFKSGQNEVIAIFDVTDSLDAWNAWIPCSVPILMATADGDPF